MSDIFREVDEELRQDRLREFWSKHGWLIIIMAAGIVLGVAGARGYQAWDRARSGEAGAKYSEAIQLLRDDDRTSGIAALDELSEDSYAQYPTLAKMRKASALVDAGEGKAAVAIFDSVAADESVDQILRDLARIRAAFVLVDEATPDEIKQRLTSLTEVDAPWRHSARELIALSLYRAGDYAEADAEYDRLMSDPAVPVGPRGRTEMMRALIAPHLAAADQK